MQICCAKPSSNGYALTYPTPNAKAEVMKTLLALGISAATIERSLATLADFGANEMLLVEERDISGRGAAKEWLYRFLVDATAVSCHLQLLFC